ncbi:hypothetical protein BZA77DRAFT_124777 [Pyronema omphalodes]|nr:hypothetical protein BZA77DRAFT_124777 [Pyronema omphalodes]
MSSNGSNIDPRLQDSDDEEQLCTYDANDKRLIGREEWVENHRWHVNRAMGVNPNCRKEVQARRQEVVRHLTLEHKIPLDRPFSHWPPKEWFVAINCAHRLFGPLYGWTKHVIEIILKQICQDTVRNNRTKRRNQLKQNATGCAQNQNNPRPTPFKNKKKIKVYLRQPNRKKTTQSLPSAVLPENPQSQSSMDESVDINDDSALILPDYLRSTSPLSSLSPMSTQPAHSSLSPDRTKHFLLEWIGVITVDADISWNDLEYQIGLYLPLDTAQQCYVVKPTTNKEREWQVLAFADELQKIFSTGDSFFLRLVKWSWIGQEDYDDNDHNYTGFENLTELPEYPDNRQCVPSQQTPTYNHSTAPPGSSASRAITRPESGTIAQGADGRLLVEEEIDAISADLGVSQATTRNGRKVKKTEKKKQNISLAAEKILTKRLQRAGYELRQRRNKDHERFASE